MKVGQLKVVSEFSLNNGVVFDLSLNHEKLNLNWETITSFINDYFKLEGNDQKLLESFVSSCNSVKKKVFAFGKKLRLKTKLLAITIYSSYKIEKERSGGTPRKS